MEVILLESVQNLGHLGDLVRVKAGYARNYLIPQGKAAFATEETKAEFEQRRKELEQAAAQRLEDAQQRAQMMQGLVVEIQRKASEEGSLFGSVSSIDIAEAVNARGIALEKSEINLGEGPLKSVGEHDISVSLHADVQLEIKLIVKPEE